MSEIIISLALIVMAYIWYLAKRRWNQTPVGPRWLRASISLFILLHSVYSVNAYVSKTIVVGWKGAFLHVSIVMLLITMALLISIMLMTINRTYLIGLKEQTTAATGDDI